MKAIYTLREIHLSLNNCVFRKHVETSGDIPPPMSGSTACVIGGKYMYIFAGHHDEGPSSTVSLFLATKNFLLLIVPRWHLHEAFNLQDLIVTCNSSLQLQHISL